jgi:hypothetical protein
MCIKYRVFLLSLPQNTETDPGSLKTWNYFSRTCQRSGTEWYWVVLSASRSGGADSNPGQVIWDLWWEKWLGWGTGLLRIFLFSLPILFPPNSGWCNRLLGDRRTKRRTLKLVPEILLSGGTRWRSGLTHCLTTFWDCLSDPSLPATLWPWGAQLLVHMSTRNLPGSNDGRRVMLTSPLPLERFCISCGRLDVSHTCRPPGPGMGVALLFYL